jgi:DNA-binding transcriptional LysR family regulator
MSRIEYSSDFKLKNVIEDWWKSNFTLPSREAIKIDSIDSCCEMVKQGLGYAIVPSTIIKKTDNYFKINLEDKDGNMIIRRTRAFYHDDWEKSKLGKTFLDFIDTLEFEDR